MLYTPQVNFEESSLLFIEALADLTANGHYPRSDDVTGQNTFRQRKEQVVRLDHNDLGPAKAVSTFLRLISHCIEKVSNRSICMVFYPYFNKRAFCMTEGTYWPE